MPYKMLNVVTAIALGWLVSTGFAGPSFAQDTNKKLPYPTSPTPRTQPTSSPRL